MDKSVLESIFKNSRNSDEIFDAFAEAMKMRINELALYKILLWNPALSKDEICMYVKKLASEFSEISYDVFMWGARVVELSFVNDDNFDAVLVFYKKATRINPEVNEPYVKSLELYNDDLKIPDPNELISFVKSGIAKVKDPSLLYFKLSEFYGKLNNSELKIHYRSLGEHQLRKKFTNHKG